MRSLPNMMKNKCFEKACPHLPKFPKSKNEKNVPTTFRWHCALQRGPHCCGWHILFTFWLVPTVPKSKTKRKNPKLKKNMLLLLCDTLTFRQAYPTFRHGCRSNSSNNNGFPQLICKQTNKNGSRHFTVDPHPLPGKAPQTVWTILVKI